MDNDLVTAIKARLSVEEVVGNYITLKRSGNSFKALSPFKSEKTPSLIVTPDKEIWKDFSSGKGGDLFSFVMEYEGVDFKEALKILAAQAGLNIAEYQSASNPHAKRQADLRQKAFEVLEITTKFYQKCLKTSTKAKSYLQKRGITASVVREFRMGYAPGGWEMLLQHLQRLKISTQRAALVGVIKKRPLPAWLATKRQTQPAERWGDFFVDRLMIPLSDTSGRIIGFTGRILDDNKEVAKYINSSQTPLYNKSKHVFGYYQARDHIRQAGFALIVEGNLDVIACHQAGYKQTVAAGGTALTVDHLKIMGRLTDDIRLAFDGDEAGIAAMERSITSAAKAKVNLSIISLPTGYDPDDLIKHNLPLWKKLVGNQQPALEWLYEKYKSQLDLKTAAGKKYLTDVMLTMINVKIEISKS